MSNQLYNILEALVIKNNIRLDQDELKLQVSSHPSYPSLHALTGVLQHFRIPNLAIKLPAEESILAQLPDCFIAHLSEEYKEALVLVEKRKGQLKITHDKRETERMSQEQFLEKWDGIIVAIEKDEAIKESTTSVVSKLLQWSLITVAVLLFGYFVFQTPGLFPKSHILLSLIGLFFSTLILRHELGVGSAVLNSFCNFSTATSCDAVLNSKGAVLFKQFKLSDISILTFSIYLLYWILFFENNYSDYFLIASLTLLAIPITLYSLYYQYRIIKKWCPLCLGIIMVLCLQAFALLGLEPLWMSGINDWNTLWLFAFTALVIIGLWYFLKPLLERKIALERLELEYYKFKRNFSVFNSVYQQETKLSIPSTSIPGEIILGNQQSELEIILVTNPFCSFCKQAHNDVEKILQATQNKVKIIIRFITGIENKEGQAYQVTSHLLQSYKYQDTAACRQALNEVFSSELVPLDEWLKKQETVVDASCDSILEKQFDWCLQNHINFTPAFYVNGIQFPKTYDRTDLVFFIDELIEQQENRPAQNSESQDAA